VLAAFVLRKGAKKKNTGTGLRINPNAYLWLEQKSFSPYNLLKSL
jgi:hypothetical protein